MRDRPIRSLPLSLTYISSKLDSKHSKYPDTNMPSLAETQIETCEKFAAGYSEWTVEGLLRLRTNDCMHSVLPASVGRKPVTNEEYGNFFKALQPVVKNFRVRKLRFPGVILCARMLTWHMRR